MSRFESVTLFQGQTGNQLVAEGQTALLRLGAAADMISNMYGPHEEAARYAKVFHAVTAVGGVAPGTAIGTTGAAALANPAGSGIDMVVQLVSMSYVSGTLGSGVVDYVAHNNPSQAAITGTAMVIVPGNLDGAAAKGKALTTATVPASGSVFRLFANLAPMLASSVLAPWRVDDFVDGAIVIHPGCGVSLQGTAAAGTSPLVRFGFVWKERPAA
jgi:hypothetical protein